MDGKVIKFKSPLLVKDLLNNFEGIGVRSSRKAPNNLPSDFKLKLGKVYYLLPSKVAEKQEDAPTPVNRIKVVITKKQLQELLANTTSIEQVLFGNGDKSSSIDAPAPWRPRLESIPEEEESTRFQGWHIEIENNISLACHMIVY